MMRKKNDEVTKKSVQRAAMVAWEQIASDAGSEDGCGAIDHFENVVWQMEFDALPTLKTRLKAHDPEVFQWVKDALRTFG